MILKLLREGLGRIIILISHLTLPKKVSRSNEDSERVKKAMEELSIYQFYACPFCVKVRREVHRLDLPIEYRDAQNDPKYREELLNGGGKIQAPCLRIDEGSETHWVYESSNIIEYLNKRFA